MITLHIIIATAIFSVMFAYRNYWQIMISREIIWHEFNEERIVDYNSKWHKWQFALQIYIGAVIAFISFISDYNLLNSLGHGLLFGSVFWLIFDTLLGYLLTKNIFHVDSNGIGTVYKRVAERTLMLYCTIINKFKKEKTNTEYLVKPLSQILLFVSKLLFVGISLTLSII